MNRPFIKGDKVSYFSSDGNGNDGSIYGTVVAAGAKTFDVLWETGKLNRLQQSRKDIRLADIEEIRRYFKDNHKHSAEGPGGCPGCSRERRKIWPTLTAKEKQAMHAKACAASALLATPRTEEEKAEDEKAAQFLKGLFG